MWDQFQDVIKYQIHFTIAQCTINTKGPMYITFTVQWISFVDEN